MESVERQTGIRPKELDELKELPEAYYSIWGVFLELNAARGSNGFGVDPLSFTEIYSYCKLYGIDLELHELKMLRRFDNVALELQAKEAKANNKSKSK